MKRYLIFSSRNNQNLLSEIYYINTVLNSLNTHELRTVLSLEYEILIIYNTSIESIFAVLLSKLRKKKVIYCFHEPFYNFHELASWRFKSIKYSILNLIHFFILRFIDKAVTFSQLGNQKLNKYLYPPIKLKKATTSLPVLEMYTLPVDRKFVKIAFLGSVNEFKNPYPFLDNEIAKFVELDIEYHFYTTSKINYPEHNLISRTIKRLSDEEFISCIKDADFIHIPHIHCTQSGIFAKALSIGRPVIVNNTANYNFNINENDFFGLIYGLDDFKDIIIKYKSNRIKYSQLSFNYFLHNLKPDFDVFAKI